MLFNGNDSRQRFQIRSARRPPLAAELKRSIDIPGDGVDYSQIST
jgi:hypothetical protein